MSTHPQDLHAFNGISLHVSITVAPENVEKLLAVLKPGFDAVTAELQCIVFEVLHDADNPGRLRIVEDWSKDVEWFVKVNSRRQSLVCSEIAPSACCWRNLKNRCANRLACLIRATAQSVLKAIHGSDRAFVD